MYRPKVVLSPELTASSAASLGRVVQSPHSDVAWLEPHRYCWVPVATKVTSSDASPQGDDARKVAVASHGIPTWTGAIYGTVPEAEIIGAAAYLLHTPPSACTLHVVDASIIGANLRRAQEALYRGIRGPTSHLVNQHALRWIVEGLRRLPRRVGGPHHWMVRQSSHFAAVPLEARAMAPPVHLVLPKEHAILLVLGDNGELEPRVPSMQALQQVREMEWHSLAAHTRAHTPLAGACEAVPLGAVHHGPMHRNMPSMPAVEQGARTGKGARQAHGERNTAPRHRRGEHQRDKRRAALRTTTRTAQTPHTPHTPNEPEQPAQWAGSQGGDSA